MTAPSLTVARWSLTAHYPDLPVAERGRITLYCEALERYLWSILDEERERADRTHAIRRVLTGFLEHAQLVARACERPGAGFRYFLARIAAHAARRALERTDNGADLIGASLAEVLRDPSSAARPDPAMDRAWARSLIDQAWHDLAGWAESGVLDHLILEALRASLGSGLNLAGIAGQLGVDPASCGRALARGRTLLMRNIREHLQAVGEDHSFAGASSLVRTLAS